MLFLYTFFKKKGKIWQKPNDNLMIVIWIGGYDEEITKKH